MRSHEFDDETDVCTRCNFTMQAIVEFAIDCGEKWERRRRLLTTFETGTAEHFPSINKAKRASRKLQQEGLGLGRGEMRVIR